MTYDIRLFRPEPSVSLTETAQRDDYVEAPLSQAQRDANARMVAALRKQWPTLETFERETGVELHDPHDGSGILIDLSGTAGAITVPYWHDKDAAMVLGRVREYLQTIYEAGGLVGYDPQTEQVLSPEIGFGLTEHVYAAGTTALNEVLRPWWRFWR